MTFGIVLDKPIPEDGRKPTARECERFRNLRTNVLPTTSGAWRIGWIKRANGNRDPYLLYRGRNSRRANDGAGWAFEMLEPEQKPITKPTKPQSKRTIPLSKLDAVHAEPTMCW